MANCKIFENEHERVALYGLSTETERFISENRNKAEIVCLLDGYKEDGEMYGYPIFSLTQAIEAKVTKIVVVARPGSCKVIAKRIREICTQNNITLLDSRGNDLLVDSRVIYDFRDVKQGTRVECLKAIDKADVVSFDLFDTLVMRTVLFYTDVFELLEKKLRSSGICVDDFAKKRLAYEKELSIDGAPKLEEIYGSFLPKSVSPAEIAQMEWNVDRNVLIARNEMIEIFKYAIDHNKRVYITTDCYYPKEWIEAFLQEIGICGYEDILISSELGKSKNQGLFDVLKMYAAQSTILHIGDDEYSDIEMATRYGIDSFRILSARDLYEHLGELGLSDHVKCIADRVKVGLFVSKKFSDPFVWEKNDSRLAIDDAYEIGYLFCSSMITDFVLWMRNKAIEDGIGKLLLCARDGYLIKRLLGVLGNSKDYLYFLTSRTAAIRAGVRDEDDLTYVDGMKFSGEPEKELLVRYGINEVPSNAQERTRMILGRSAGLRDNYVRYAKRVGLSENDNIAIFDFVAKGTTQLFLEKILDSDIKGYYFLQLEPGFMADRGLNIEPFYSEEERETSEIFNSYYILETIVTSPDPSVLEFDQDGMPVFDKETRNSKDIECVLRVQRGIEDFYKSFIRILGAEDCYKGINKSLDEKMLSLIKRININDEGFNALIVEDPFFGRMTKIVDVI